MSCDVQCFDCFQIMTKMNLTMSSAHASFEPIRSKKIDSLNITVEEFRHRETGALHYHLAAENNENVFLGCVGWVGWVKILYLAKGPG